MQYDSIMVRYGELTLKGKNKKVFIDTLSNNIKQSLNDMKELVFEKQYDRFYIHLDMFSDIDEIFSTKERSLAGITAPPMGLCLEKVYY
jgi:thiamine biosynthesis protein ThiI